MMTSSYFVCIRLLIDVFTGVCSGEEHFYGNVNVAIPYLGPVHNHLWSHWYSCFVIGYTWFFMDYNLSTGWSHIYTCTNPDHGCLTSEQNTLKQIYVKILLTRYFTSSTYVLTLTVKTMYLFIYKKHYSLDYRVEASSSRMKKNY